MVDGYRIALPIALSRAVQRRSIRWLILVALVVPLAAETAMAAQIAAPSEYELKAVFVYNFIKFTEWPTAKLGKSGDPFVIGILGKDSFVGALDKVVEGEMIYSKPVVVRRFARADEAVASHALFISASEEQTVLVVLRLLDAPDAGVLTISETENFILRGGVIGLKKENKKVVFSINLIAANRAGLNINAQLLKIAKDVVK